MNIARIALALMLSLMIAFPPQVIAAVNGGKDQSTAPAPNPPAQPAITQTAGQSGSQILQPPTAVSTFIDDLENGRMEKYAAKDADIAHLSNQEIEIIDRGQTRVYDLNQKNVEIPFVAFTGLKIIYDTKNGNLIFEGYRGQDKTGENGVLVARQTIRGVDLKVSAQDAELFQFVDSRLNLHVVDMGMVATQVFKSPIPIFQKVWQPNLETQKLWAADSRKFKVNAGFLTRGTKPMNLATAAVVPHDDTGATRLAAGDFYVSYSVEGEKEDRAVGIFARETTYSQMIRGYQTLQWQAALLSPDPAIQSQVEKIISDLQDETERQEMRLVNEKMSPQVRVVVSSLNPSSIASLDARRTATGELKKNSVDTFTPMEWTATYADIAKNLAADTDVKEDAKDKAAEEQWFKFINKMNAQNKEIEKENKKATLFSKLVAIRKTLTSGTSLKIIGSVLGLAAAAMPYAYDNFEVLQQIKVIAWSYETFFPAILKDAVYRTPLLLSMASLAAIWPAGIGFSAAVGATLNQMAEKVKTETSRKAVYIKDLARSWGNLNNWQRITSFGMRLYAWMVLPYWRVLIEHIAQQKTFFSAVNNDLNPLQKILADSELGKKLGLTADQRVGLSHVFGAKKADKIDLNLKMQSALSEENRKLDTIALLVAATLVAEKHKMDPALLMLLGQESSDGLRLDKVSEILDSPAKRTEWQMLSHLLIKEMAQLKKSSIVVDQNLQSLIEQYYQSAEKIAAKVDAMSPLRLRVERFRIAFSSQLSNKVKAAANFAVQDHEFLKTVYTNEFVSDQVNKEFTIDHLMVVGIIGLYGERADLSHPEHLAADANGFLWTSRAHWYDIFLNTFSHFFLSGASMALVLQKIKPKVAANYAPIEDYEHVSREREQGLMSATKDWMQVFNPIKSDLGGIITKRFVKRFTTLTAGITMMMLLRVGIWHQPLEVALMAWSFSFITAQWFFGWVWDPVQRGNQMEGERLEEMDKQLKVARREIKRGDLEKARTQLTELYTKFNPKVLTLFDLSKMSQTELLMISVDQPPIFTQANKWLSWITTWGAAVSSTVLAIPLSVILMDDKLINAPSTWYTWVPVSVALYVASYFLSKDYAIKYRDYFLKVKQKWTDRKNADAAANAELSRQMIEEIGKSETVKDGAHVIRVSRGALCEALFSPIPQ